MRDELVSKLEKMKRCNIESYWCLFDFSSSQKKALVENHGCKTLHDLVNICEDCVPSIKGFSRKNYEEMRRAVLSRLNSSICCYQNKYIELWIPTVGCYAEESKFKFTVINHYPVDRALKVGFDRLDIWGHPMYEKWEQEGYTEGFKGYVWVKIDGVLQSEIILRFSRGEQLMNTDFYELDCRIEIIQDKLKEEVAEVPVEQDESPPIIELDKTLSKVDAIRCLEKQGILSEKETNDIIMYLNSEADIWRESDIWGEGEDMDFADDESDF